MQYKPPLNPFPLHPTQDGQDPPAVPVAPLRLGSPSSLYLTNHEMRHDRGGKGALHTQGTEAAGRHLRDFTGLTFLPRFCAAGRTIWIRCVHRWIESVGDRRQVD